MSRGPAGWLSCATVVSLSHLLGFDSRYAKQLIFASIVSLQAYPDYNRTELFRLSLGYLQNALIVFIIFQLARWLLAPSNTSQWTGLGKVLLLPGLTTHTRLFPKRHSFDYSYLVVGIPVGWEGISGGMVSSSSKEQSWLSLSRRGWYHIDPEDYLDRGSRKLGLRGKLDAYLRSQVRIGNAAHTSLALLLKLCTGRRSSSVSSRLPGNRGEVPGVPLQPCLVLVSLRSRHVSERHDH